MYSIYHIQGIKIGCSTQVLKRIKEQGFTNYEILEEHLDIYIASDRELELQKQYGYKLDTIPYWKSVKTLRKNATFESARKGGLKGGETSKKLGHIQNAQKIGCVLGGRAGKGKKNISAKLQAENGHMKMMAQKAKEKTSIPVIAIRLSDNSHKEYTSQSEAGRQLNINPSNINIILHGGNQKTAKGYTFKYKNI